MGVQGRHDVLAGEPAAHRETLAGDVDGARAVDPPEERRSGPGPGAGGACHGHPGRPPG